METNKVVKVLNVVFTTLVLVASAMGFASAFILKSPLLGLTSVLFMLFAGKILYYDLLMKK